MKKIILITFVFIVSAFFLRTHWIFHTLFILLYSGTCVLISLKSLPKWKLSFYWLSMILLFIPHYILGGLIDYSRHKLSADFLLNLAKEIEMGKRSGINIEDSNYQEKMKLSWVALIIDGHSIDYNNKRLFFTLDAYGIGSGGGLVSEWWLQDIEDGWVHQD